MLITQNKQKNYTAATHETDTKTTMSSRHH
jgi:hypothetical protein